MRVHRRWWGALMVVPPTIFILVFGLLPVLYSVWMSMYEIGLVSRTYVGLQNYRTMFMLPKFWGAIRVTAKFVTIYFFAQVIGSYLIALVLDKLHKVFAGAILTAYRVPGLVGGIATVAVWRWFFLYYKGGLNQLLGYLHISPIMWFGNPTVAPWALGFVLATAALTGNVLIYMAALAQINPEIIEAARLDGASELQLIWYVITPLTQPMRLYVILMSFIGALGIWETPYFFTGGGPLGSTRTIMFAIYQEGFRGGDTGLGLAMSAILVLFTLGVSFFFMRKLKVQIA